MSTSKRNTAVNALRDEHTSPPVLHVHGSALAYHSGARLVVAPAIPPGANPTVLTFYLKVEGSTGQPGIVALPFSWHDRGESYCAYKEVEIIADSGEKHISAIETAG